MLIVKLNKEEEKDTPTLENFSFLQELNMYFQMNGQDYLIREFGFSIEIVLRVEHLSKALYIMNASKLMKLKMQLEELLGKGLI